MNTCKNVTNKELFRIKNIWARSESENVGAADKVFSVRRVANTWHANVDISTVIIVVEIIKGLGLFANVAGLIDNYNKNA